MKDLAVVFRYIKCVLSGNICLQLGSDFLRSMFTLLLPVTLQNVQLRRLPTPSCQNVFFWVVFYLKVCAEVLIMLKVKNSSGSLFGRIATARKARHAKPVCAVSALGGVKQTGKRTHASLDYIRQSSNPQPATLR